jgi:uncharacterized protein (DUF302 family)
MNFRVYLTLILFLWLSTGGSVRADGLLMARSLQMFPEAMTSLQSAISARGYKITRLQEVNENLARRDYKSDMYRVVFFGKYEEIKALTADYPELIPFLPLSITIFAEGNQAILVSAHPRAFEKLFPDPRLKPVFERWEKDVSEMMDEVREAR